MTETREPFVARIAMLLCDEINRLGRVPSPEEFLEVCAHVVPDATIAEGKEAIELYMSVIEAKEQDEIDAAATGVIKIDASPTERERQRFERWASRALLRDEAQKLLARSKGGDYVLATARAGWAAWEARGLIDAGGE